MALAPLTYLLYTRKASGSRKPGEPSGRTWRPASSERGPRLTSSQQRWHLSRRCSLSLTGRELAEGVSSRPARWRITSGPSMVTTGPLRSRVRERRRLRHGRAVFLAERYNRTPYTRSSITAVYCSRVVRRSHGGCPTTAASLAANLRPRQAPSTVFRRQPHHDRWHDVDHLQRGTWCPVEAQGWHVPYVGDANTVRSARRVRARRARSDSEPPPAGAPSLRKRHQARPHAPVRTTGEFSHGSPTPREGRSARDAPRTRWHERADDDQRGALGLRLRVRDRLAQQIDGRSHAPDVQTLLACAQAGHTILSEGDRRRAIES